MRSLVVSFSFLLVAAPGAKAQECLEQVTFPAVGRWAEYKALYNGRDPLTVRYAVIGAENRGGTDLKWLELRMVGAKKDQNFIYQMLVPASAAELGNVQELILKTGNKPPMRMNDMMMSMIRGQLQKQSFLSDICKGVTLVGKERVAVPAGRFETLHSHSDQYRSDSWVAPEFLFRG